MSSNFAIRRSKYRVVSIFDLLCITTSGPNIFLSLDSGGNGLKFGKVNQCIWNFDRLFSKCRTGNAHESFCRYSVLYLIYELVKNFSCPMWSTKVIVSQVWLKSCKTVVIARRLQNAKHPSRFRSSPVSNSFLFYCIKSVVAKSTEI